MDRPDIRILADADELSRVAAVEFVRLANEAVGAGERFTVALSGGSTPNGVYRFLADKKTGYRAHVPWNKVHVFWGDERHVSPDHPESNYLGFRRAFLARDPDGHALQIVERQCEEED